MFELFDFTINIRSSFHSDAASQVSDDTSVDEILDKLNEPCNMDYILLCSNWAKQTYRAINVKDFTNREVCERVYAFYEHKTHRRLMGDHIFLEGWFHPLPNEPNVFKPLMYGS